MELVRGGELFDVIVSNKTGGGRGGRGGRGGPRGPWVLANSMDSMDGGELIRIWNNSLKYIYLYKICMYICVGFKAEEEMTIKQRIFIK